MKVLVISLLRLGDTIMTTPVIQSLRKRYPGAQIHLLLNSEFSSVTPLIDEVDRFYFFDREGMQQKLTDAAAPILSAYDQLDDLIAQLNNEGYEEVINLTHTILSGWVASLIGSKSKNGLSLNQDARPIFGSPWFKHLNDYIAGGGREVFHFSDVFKFATADGEPAQLEPGIQLQETAEGRAEVDEYLNPPGPFILVQPNTSDPKKNWGISAWKTALRQFSIINPNHRIFLMGAPNEKNSLSELERALGQDGTYSESIVCSLQGAFSLLKKADLLVTGDTSIKHLAAASECKVVELSLGSSDYRKTGVYKHKGVIIQSREYCAPCSHSGSCHRERQVCAERIPPEVVSLVMSKVLDDNIHDLKVVAEEYSREVEILTAIRTGLGYWLAVPVRGEFNPWILNRWLERSAWKFLLQNEHIKTVAAYGTEARELTKSVSSLFPNLTRTRWQLALGQIETDTHNIDRQVGHLKNSLRRVIGNFDQAEGIEDLVTELRGFYERYDDSPALASFLFSENRSKGVINFNFSDLRKVQDYLNEIHNRTQIKIKLMRTIKSQLVEPI